MFKFVLKSKKKGKMVVKFIISLNKLDLSETHYCTHTLKTLILALTLTLVPTLYDYSICNMYLLKLSKDPTT